MLSFVVEYNRRTGESKITEYEDIAAATRERFRLMNVRADENVEIATILGRSLDAIRKTHSRYFEQDTLASA